MPHLGQRLALVSVTSGCIGHTYTSAAGAGASAWCAVAWELAPHPMNNTPLASENATPAKIPLQSSLNVISGAERNQRANPIARCEESFAADLATIFAVRRGAAAGARGSIDSGGGLH
jgi:hypothetical protein